MWPAKAAKILLPEQHREHARLSSQIDAARKRIERDTLKDVGNVDHNEIKQQMRGEAPSTLTYVKPQLDCPRRSFIAGVFWFEEVGTWSETVHALSAPFAKTQGPQEGERRGEGFVPALLWR